jgi:hypothetical protein
METIPGHDHYLDPPEYPTKDRCYICEDIFDIDDLDEIGGHYYCGMCKPETYDD